VDRGGLTGDVDVAVEAVVRGVDRRLQVGEAEGACLGTVVDVRGGHDPADVPAALVEDELQRAAWPRLDGHAGLAEPGRAEAVEEFGHGRREQSTAFGKELAILGGVAERLVSRDPHGVRSTCGSRFLHGVDLR
jgi:hypothetical protein